MPSDWVAESTRSYSNTGQGGGYGYLWWVSSGGPHLTSAVPYLNMVVVHRGGAAARDAIRGGVLQYYKNVHAIFSHLPESYGDHLPRLRGIEETIANLPYERFCRDQAVFGDAAEVERTMRRFAEEVMPRLA